MHRPSQAEAGAITWRWIRLGGSLTLFSIAVSATSFFRRGDTAVGWVAVIFALALVGLMTWSFVRYLQTRAGS